MDHVVYVDAKSQELEKLLDGSKTKIIRGATGRKLPYGRVNKQDVMFFIRNNGEGKVLAKAEVKSVFNSEKMDKETSVDLVKSNQTQLQLDSKAFKKWAGKRYVVLIEIAKAKEITPFAIDKKSYGNMDDWLPVKDIATVRI